MNLVLSDWLTTGCRYGGSIGESGFIRLVDNRMYVCRVYRWIWFYQTG